MGKVNEQEIVLLTNHLSFGAATISAIYKDRRQIELLFKALRHIKNHTCIQLQHNAMQLDLFKFLLELRIVQEFREGGARMGMTEWHAESMTSGPASKRKGEDFRLKTR